MSNTRNGSSSEIVVESKEEIIISETVNKKAVIEETEKVNKTKTKRKRIRQLESPTETEPACLPSSSSSSSLPPIQERPFAAEDFDYLTVNEHMRFLANSAKVGHAVLIKDNTNEEIALQYPIPEGKKEETTKVRPLVKIEAIDRYGSRHYRARTPDTNTLMYAKRYIHAEFQDKTQKEDTLQALRIACFSPSFKEPFWGGKEKSIPLFRETLKKSAKKELEKELKEIGIRTKGGAELVVHGPSVRERDNIKTRNPDQNTVMQESAKDAYEHFLDAMTSELHSDMKKILKRAVDANLRDSFYSNYRPEWLHAEGYSLTPMSKDPQQADNLGAAPKWANTEMMILERIAKWFALNRPESFIKIKPHFEMLLDSELIKKIKFEVTIEEKKRFIKFLQEIDPFKEYPLFRKAADIAQGTAITYNLLHGISPISRQKIIGASNSPLSSPQATSSSLLSAEPIVPALSLLRSLVPSSTSAFTPVASSEKSNTLLEQSSLLPKKQKIKSQMPTHLTYEKSLVQILTTSQQPEYDEPWLGTHVSGCSGSGLVILHEDKKYILTNAHVVENSVLLRVRLANNKKKYEATRKCVSYQCDLALLEVSDPQFQAFAKPVELGEMVSIQDKVCTVGFPMGGTEISVTKGIVSRIQVQDYCMSGLDMLQVQVDAAINSGNSGGPVFKNDTVVGVAFQAYNNAQSLGYMIPIPIIRHFLTEAFSKKEYRGFPILPVTFQTLENPSLRAYYGMTEKQTGIRVNKVDFLTDAYGKLLPDDILLEIDSLPISNDGTVDLPDVGNCIDFVHVTHMKYIGDAVQLKVLRRNAETKAAEIHHLNIALDHVPLETEKVPQTEWDKMPTYYIASGIAFTPLSRNYLEGKGSDLDGYYILEEGCLLANAPKKSSEEQYVVVNDIFDSKETEGYEEYINSIIKEVNDKPIRNIRDVIEAIEGNKEVIHVITTYEKKKIVVKNMSKEEHDKLLKKYHIKSDRSEDLLVASSSPSKVLSAPLPEPASLSLPSTSIEIDAQEVEKEEEEKEEKRELTINDMPGYRKYRNKLDQMEAFYKQYPLADDEDLDEDFEEVSEDDEEDSSDEEEELSTKKEQGSKLELVGFSNRNSFFNKKKDSASPVEDNKEQIKKRRMG